MILAMLVLTTCHILLLSTGRGTNMSILHSWKINCLLSGRGDAPTCIQYLCVALLLRKCTWPSVIQLC